MPTLISSLAPQNRDACIKIYAKSYFSSEIKKFSLARCGKRKTEMESQRAAYIFCYYLNEAGPRRAINSSAHTLCVCAAVYLFKAGLPTATTTRTGKMWTRTGTAMGMGMGTENATERTARAQLEKCLLSTFSVCIVSLKACVLCVVGVCCTAEWPKIDRWDNICDFGTQRRIFVSNINYK